MVDPGGAKNNRKHVGFFTITGLDSRGFGINCKAQPRLPRLLFAGLFVLLRFGIHDHRAPEFESPSSDVNPLRAKEVVVLSGDWTEVRTGDKVSLFNYGVFEFKLFAGH